MPQLERVAKVTVLHYRKPGVSEEEFYRRMNEEFTPMATPIINRYKILKFVLNHSPSHLRNEAADAVALKGWTLSDYDGSVEYWVQDVDEIKKGLMIDPDWTGKVAVLEEDIGDKHRGLVQVSFEEVYIENGKIVNLDNGKSAFSVVKSS
ncbi:hypothetical protein DL768_002591 [Monosporascus sp. mg162]|nr:hypothetical protein DL768_002591 [Monosporascus sp. mg162]